MYKNIFYIERIISLQITISENVIKLKGNIIDSTCSIYSRDYVFLIEIEK